MVVNISPATTAIFPRVAAYNGPVDVIYYATTAASKDDENAVWNAYLAQTIDNGANFTQSKVSNTPNHAGASCTERTACPDGTRKTINSQNGCAAIIYTDGPLTMDSDGSPIPQVMPAQQNP